MTVTVLSEREQNPAAPGWHDCVFASGIMALAYAGFAHFPLGYTANEREALERSCSRPPETGATMADLDEAVKNRYGITLHTGTIAGLSQPNIGLIKFGINGNLPASSPWRRWDPAFTGEHAVFIETEVGLLSKVFDPEAPMGYGGDQETDAAITQWAHNVPDTRFTVLGEFAHLPGLPGSISIFNTQYPTYVHSYADAFVWTLRVLQNNGWSHTSGYIPDPAFPVNFNNRVDPFGSDYPTYVHSYADAIQWIGRALRQMGKIA